MSAERPTPETDAAKFYSDIGGWVVGVAKCQTLERQRDVARENTKAWHGEYRALNDLHRELGLEHGKAIRQRDRLLEALKKQACLTAYYNGHSDGYRQHPNGGLFWENYLCPEARAVISEVEGGR